MSSTEDEGSITRLPEAGDAARTFLHLRTHVRHPSARGAGTADSLSPEPQHPDVLPRKDCDRDRQPSPLSSRLRMPLARDQLPLAALEHPEANGDIQAKAVLLELSSPLDLNAELSAALEIAETGDQLPGPGRARQLRWRGTAGRRRVRRRPEPGAKPVGIGALDARQRQRAELRASEITRCDDEAVPLRFAHRERHRILSSSAFAQHALRRLEPDLVETTVTDEQSPLSELLPDPGLHLRRSRALPPLTFLRPDHPAPLDHEQRKIIRARALRRASEHEPEGGEQHREHDSSLRAGGGPAPRSFPEP
jgi:hypothetical protein